MSRERTATDDQNHNEIRRILSIVEWTPTERTNWMGERMMSRSEATRTELLVGLRNKQVRLRFPNRYQQVRRLNKPSTDFLCLTSSLITDLLPASIYADALEELYPEQSDVAKFMRDWNSLRQQQEDRQ